MFDRGRVRTNGALKTRRSLSIVQSCFQKPNKGEDMWWTWPTTRRRIREIDSRRVQSLARSHNCFVLHQYATNYRGNILPKIIGDGRSRGHYDRHFDQMGQPPFFSISFYSTAFWRDGGTDCTLRSV